MKSLKLQLFFIIGVLEITNGQDPLPDISNTKNIITGGITDGYYGNKTTIKYIETTTPLNGALNLSLPLELLKPNNKYLNNLNGLTPNQLLALRDRLLLRINDDKYKEKKDMMVIQLDALTQFMEKLKKEKEENTFTVEPDNNVTDLPDYYEDYDSEINKKEESKKFKFKIRSPESIAKYKKLVQNMSYKQKRLLRGKLTHRLKSLKDLDEIKSVQEMIDIIKAEEEKDKVQFSTTTSTTPSPLLHPPPPPLLPPPPLPPPTATTTSTSTLKPLQQGKPEVTNKVNQRNSVQKANFLENKSKAIKKVELGEIGNIGNTTIDLDNKAKTIKRDILPQLVYPLTSTVNPVTKAISLEQKPNLKTILIKKPEINMPKNNKTSLEQGLSNSTDGLKHRAVNLANSSVHDDVPGNVMAAPGDPMEMQNEMPPGFSGGGGSYSSGSSSSRSYSRRSFSSGGSSSGGSSMIGGDIISVITHPRTPEQTFMSLIPQVEQQGLKPQVIMRFTQEISSGQWMGPDLQTLIRRKTIVEGNHEAETEPTADGEATGPDLSDINPEIFNLATMEFRYRTLVKSLTKTQKTKVVKQWTKLSSSAKSMEERDTMERRKNIAMGEEKGVGGTTEEAETEPDMEGSEMSQTVVKKETKVKRMKILKKKKDTETLEQTKKTKSKTKGESEAGEGAKATTKKSNEGDSRESTEAPKVTTEATTAVKKANEGEDKEKTEATVVTTVANLELNTKKSNEGEDHEKGTTGAPSTTPEDPDDPLKLGATKFPKGSKTTMKPISTTPNEEDPDDPLKLGTDKEGKDGKGSKKGKRRKNPRKGPRRKNPAKRRKNPVRKNKPKYRKRIRASLCPPWNKRVKPIINTPVPTRPTIIRRGNKPKVIYVREPCPPDYADNREPNIYMSMVDEPVAALHPQCSQSGECSVKVNDRDPNTLGDYSSNLIR